MKTITLKIENEKDLELVRNFLRTTKFKDSIETVEDEDSFSDEELQVFSERWEKYEKNQSSAISLKDFKNELKNKYGL
jgi:hypothetical protein